MKSYRSINFNDERKWKSSSPHDDVLQVGKLKAVGYVGYTKIDACYRAGMLLKEEAPHIINHLLENNKFVHICDEFNGSGNSCMTWIWAGDYFMIDSLIQKHASKIKKNNWPLIPEQFFARIIADNIGHDENPIMYHVINDFFNSWCLWCEQPIINSDKFNPMKLLGKFPNEII